MRARELHGQLITPTHRPEEKGGFFSGLRNSLIPPECSWGPLLKYASGSSPSFIERRGAGAYLIFVIFFTQAGLSNSKFYT